jgi:hypothetical protein
MAVVRKKFDIRLVIGFAALVGVTYALVAYSRISPTYYDGIYDDEKRAAYSKPAD